MDIMIKNLILSGGGIKGLSFIGLLKAFEELDLFKYIKLISCSSIGSLIGCFMVTKFSADEIIELVL